LALTDCKKGAIRRNWLQSFGRAAKTCKVCATLPASGGANSSFCALYCQPRGFFRPPKNLSVRLSDFQITAKT
jgi:hypothetical protein